MVLPQSILVKDWKDERLRNECRNLEYLAFQEYRGPLDPTRDYILGPVPVAFNYLLLDASIIAALSSADLSTQQGWEIFLKAIFYIGKGTKKRPNDHFHETLKFLEGDRMVQPRKKIRTISEIWDNDAGVFILYAFRNRMHEEAQSRKSLMISALCSCNLSNCGKETYYGVTTTMTPQDRKLLGGFLLSEIWENFVLEPRDEALVPHYPMDFARKNRGGNQT